MISLKHLAREVGVEAYPLRQLLREKLEHPRNGRWKWPDADDPEYQQARSLALELSRKPGRSSAGSAAKKAASQPTPTRSPPATGSVQDSGVSPKRRTRKLSLSTSKGASTSTPSKKGST